jgi:hypothetical protein
LQEGIIYNEKHLEKDAFLFFHADTPESPDRIIESKCELLQPGENVKIKITIKKILRFLKGLMQ